MADVANPAGDSEDDTLDTAHQKSLQAFETHEQPAALPEAAQAPAGPAGPQAGGGGNGSGGGASSGAPLQLSDGARHLTVAPPTVDALSKLACSYAQDAAGAVSYTHLTLPTTPYV